MAFIREKTTLVIEPGYDFSKAPRWDLERIMRLGSEEQRALASPWLAKLEEEAKLRAATFKKRAEKFVEELKELSERHDLSIRATTEYDCSVLELDDGYDGYGYDRLIP